MKSDLPGQSDVIGLHLLTYSARCLIYLKKVGNRGTVLTRFSVTPAKEKALQEKMEELNIREEDIQETFIRSGGRGGQHVNKTSTCVYLKHLPTGTEVKCQQERSQSLNRYRARVILTAKIETMILGKESEEQQKREKIRRQKRKRSKRAKEKMLADKRIVAAKKQLRAAVHRNEKDA